jgi:hypothetical protein
MSSKKKRDLFGRFTAGSQDSDSEKSDTVRVTTCGKMKSLVVAILILLLGLPWSVLFFQPAKDYGHQVYDFVGNVTNQLKDNLCSCPLKTGRTEGLF